MHNLQITVLSINQFGGEIYLLLSNFLGANGYFSLNENIPKSFYVQYYPSSVFISNFNKDYVHIPLIYAKPIPQACFSIGLMRCL